VLGGITDRLDGSDAVLQEIIEMPGQIMFLESAQRSLVGNRPHVVEMYVGIDQPWQHPATGNVDDPVATPGFWRDFHDAAAGDRDIAKAVVYA
jgi:hypothetical protein